MNRSILCLLALNLCLLPANGLLPAQDKGTDKPVVKKLTLPAFADSSKTLSVITALEREIEMKNFAGPMKLSDALGRFHEEMALQGVELPVIVDEVAFRAEHPDASPPNEVQVKFPQFPKKMSVSTALQLALAQIPTDNATYLIRKGNLIITTKDQASIKNLLREKVVTHIHDKTLAEAIYQLADLTGASIVLDPRATEKLMTPVSATFPNGASLESAVALLTDMAGLKMIVMGEAMYVTTAENAQKLESLQKQLKSNMENQTKKPNVVGPKVPGLPANPPSP